jgi:hypothetical protein
MSCVSEPVSYLRLERYNLHELPAAEESRVAEHLARCPVCRACYARIQADARDADVALLAAKLSRPVSPPKAATRRGIYVTLLASAACLMLFLLEPLARDGTKGGELALELVRMSSAGQLLEPTHFAPGDRFKLAVSCPPELAGSVRVLAFQGSEVFEPVAAQALPECGNRRTLTGAWQLDGSEPVELCVVFGAGTSALRLREALPESHVCAHVAPVAIE